ncbi:hypothetical protein [Nocardioides sp. SR21]|uniref:hypothetical protein n=1 Tax=Nocardioides sp. SR21 TaxID=2919501 RepID=UPI001FAA61CE|nr:hypothetical protein [Nocardioides sp. SR21]
MTNTIGSIASASALTATTSAQPPRGKGAFDAVADVLGMAADDIAAAVTSGTSLLDLAEQKGVSSEDLLTALEGGAPADLKDRSDLREIVTRIASETGAHGPGGPGGPGGPPPGPPPSGVMSGNLTEDQSTTLDVLSSLLEMDEEELTEAIQEGGLADLLEEKGIDLTELANALENSLSGTTTGFQVDVRC